MMLPAPGLWVFAVGLRSQPHNLADDGGGGVSVDLTRLLTQRFLASSACFF